MRVDDIIRLVNNGKFSFGKYVCIECSGCYFSVKSKNIQFWAQRKVISICTISDNIIDKIEVL